MVGRRFNSETTETIFKRLNGRKHAFRGNHDPKWETVDPGFQHPPSKDSVTQRYLAQPNCECHCRGLEPELHALTCPVREDAALKDELPVELNEDRVREIVKEEIALFLVDLMPEILGEEVEDDKADLREFIEFITGMEPKDELPPINWKAE